MEDNRPYTERMVDFTESLPEADQSHIDSINDEYEPEYPNWAGRT